MTRDTILAFAHPESRAEATAPEAEVADRISLRDHIVAVEIGAFQPERGRTQRLRFNVVVEVSRVTGADDDVDRVLSYDRITDAIAAELAAERLNLLETLAERIAARILREPQSLRAFVRVEKLDLGPGALGVEIARSREDFPDAPEEKVATRPALVVFLSNAAIDGPGLKRWLDDLEARKVPAVLCVGPPDLPIPRADGRLAQRRIDLLAIEQNAWILAGRDPRCIVVDSRTELDWACGKGRISVWAPSKMVLDAVTPPASFDAPYLAAWLSQEMAADRLVFVDCAPTHGVSAATLPVDTDKLL